MSKPPLWLLNLAKTSLRTRRLVIRPLKKGDDRAILPAVRESLKEIAPFPLILAVNRVAVNRFLTRSYVASSARI